MMNRQIILSLLVFQLLSTNFWAQNTSVQAYDREGIYLRTEFWRGPVFVKDGAIKPVGFLYKNLRPEFEKTPSVMPMFKKAQRNEKISFAIGILGLAGATAGAIMAFKSVDNKGYLINERQYRQGINLWLGSILFSAAINIPLKIKSRQQIDDAIWLRNRALLGG